MTVSINGNKRNICYDNVYRQREEFARASKSSGLIHQAFSTIRQEDNQCRNYGNLTQRLYMIQETDMIHEWGKRVMENGTIELLEGFDFNSRSTLFEIMHVPIASDINGATGIGQISIPPFIPLHAMRNEGNASHVQFTLAAACIDFQSGWYDVRSMKSNFLPVRDEISLKLMTMVEVLDERPILLLLGIAFYFKANNHYYLSRTSGGLCLSVVKPARGIKEA